VTLNASTIFRADLNGLSPGNGYEQLQVTGTVTLGGASLAVGLGFDPPVGSTFTIINNDGADPVVGAFNSLPEGAILMAGGKPLRISYAGGSGNDVVLTRISPPSTLTSLTNLITGQRVLQATGGLAGFSYAIQAASNLDPVIQWSTLGSAVANSAGVFSFTDTSAPLFPMRLYRALSP
jgi:hypothetical protein